MKAKKLSWALALSIFALCSCSSISKQTGITKEAVMGAHVTKTTKAHYPLTYPDTVTLTHKSKLNTPYKVIGKIKVNRHSFVGTKRQQAIIDDLMKNFAAFTGGNAVIHIRSNEKVVTGEIVRLTNGV